MDDIVSRELDIDIAIDLQFQLQEVLESSRVILFKWNSSLKKLLNISLVECQRHSFLTASNVRVQTIGFSKQTVKINSHSMLQSLKINFIRSKIFWLSFHIYTYNLTTLPFFKFLEISRKNVKIFLQKLWFRKLNWRDLVSKTLARGWVYFTFSLI